MAPTPKHEENSKWGRYEAGRYFGTNTVFFCPRLGGNWTFNGRTPDNGEVDGEAEASFVPPKPSSKHQLDEYPSSLNRTIKISGWETVTVTVSPL